MRTVKQRIRGRIKQKVIVLISEIVCRLAVEIFGYQTERLELASTWSHSPPGAREHKARAKIRGKKLTEM